MGSPVGISKATACKLSVPRAIQVAGLVFAVAPLAAGCGGAIAGGIAGLAFSGSHTTNAPASVLVASASTFPADPQLGLPEYAEGDVTVDFTLVDPEGNPTDVSVAYSLRGGSPGVPIASLRSLETSQAGTTHTFTWDSRRDLNGQRTEARLEFRVGGLSAFTDFFVVDNTSPPSVLGVEILSSADPEVVEPGPRSTGAIPLRVLLADAEETDVNLFADLVAMRGDRRLLSLAGGTRGRIGPLPTSSSGAGVEHELIWLSIEDVPLDTEGVIRLFAVDSKVERDESGMPVPAVVPVSVSNTSPSVTVVAGVESNAGRVPINYTVTDPGGEDCDVIGTRFSLSGAEGPFLNATEAIGPPSEGREALSTSADGVPHTFIWNSSFDLDASLADPMLSRALSGVPVTARCAFEVRVRDKATGREAIGRSVPFVLDERLIVTVAGGATGEGLLATEVKLRGPHDVTTDRDGNIYIADTESHRILRVDATTNRVSVVAGDGNVGYSAAEEGGPATRARLNGPRGVAVDSTGAVYVADTGNGRVRRIDPDTGVIRTVMADLGAPIDLVFDPAGGLLVLDLRGNRYIRSTSGGEPEVFGARSGTVGFRRGDADGDGDLTPADAQTVIAVVTLDREPLFRCLDLYDVNDDGELSVDDALPILRLVFQQGPPLPEPFFACGLDPTPDGLDCFEPPQSIPGCHDDSLSAADIDLLRPVAIDSDRAGVVYLSDAGNRALRTVDSEGDVRSLAGDGRSGSSNDGALARTAQFRDLSGIAVSDGRGSVYFAEIGSRSVRTIDDDGLLRTIVGPSEPAIAQELIFPRGIEFEEPDRLLVTDSGLGVVYAVDLSKREIDVRVGGGDWRRRAGDGGFSRQPIGRLLDLGPVGDPSRLLSRRYG